MPVLTIADVPERLLAPGICAHAMHGDALSVVHVRLDAGADLPRHQHPHEQSTTVISGRLLLTIGDETFDLHPGMTAFIPGNVPHHAHAPEAALVLDVFTPTRDDLR